MSEGEVLEAFVTGKRDKKSALKFLRKAMKRYGYTHELVNLDNGTASGGQ